jgi:colicin import membrane protein
VKKPNTGVVVSSVAHVAVLAYAVVGFTHATPFDPSMESVAVEVLTASEFDKMTKGDRNAKKVDTVPKVEAKKIAAVTPDPRPPAPEAKENVEAPPPPPEPQKVEAPEPPTPEPKPEPKPEPPKQAEVPPPEPKPEPKPPEKKVDEQSQAKLDDLIKKEVAKKPEPKPEPKKVEKKPEKPKPKFDPSKIATLIDKRDPGKVAQGGQQIAEVTTAGTSSGTASQLALTRASLLGNMIREQLYMCWNPPVGASGMNDLLATIQFNLTPEGILVGQPSLQGSSANPAFQAFAESAMRAVHSCTQQGRPLKLPPEDYNLWRTVTLDFKIPQT